MSSSRFAVVVAIVVVALEGRGRAVELKNDSFDSGMASCAQGGFVAGEMGASRFVPAGGSSYQVNSIFVLYGGADAMRDVTVHIYDDSALATAPGVELYMDDFTLTGQAVPTGFNMITPQTAVVVPGAFRVAIEFQNDGLPSVARDTTAMCGLLETQDYPDRNYIYYQDPSDGSYRWGRSSMFGVPGDWIIRADVTVMGGPGTPDAAPGAPDGAPGTPDAAPGAPDAAPTGGDCAVNTDCPIGQYCGAGNRCTLDCRVNSDCASGGMCNSLGMCVAATGDEGGCGCRLAGRDPASPRAWIAGLLVGLALLVRGRRRR